jgi:hypothetical protein
VLLELRRIREHADFVASRDEDTRRGVRHFRDCHEGCPAMSGFLAFKSAGVDNHEALDNACRSCTLDRAPMREATIVQEYAMRPDALIPWGRVPYYVMAGVQIERARMRVF